MPMTTYKSPVTGAAPERIQRALVGCATFSVPCRVNGGEPTVATYLSMPLAVIEPVSRRAPLVVEDGLALSDLDVPQLRELVVQLKVDTGAKTRRGLVSALERQVASEVKRAR